MPWPEGAPPALELETGAHNEPGSVARIVTWIPWDSGFRGSGLRVGDLIVGHEDVRYTPETVEDRLGIGDASFSRWFDRRGYKPGDPFTVHVLGDDDEVRTVTGRLGAHRIYRDAEGRRLLSEDGPPWGERDGFDYDWANWYRQFVDAAKTILIGWDYFGRTHTRNLAERLPPLAARVDFLEARYPGALARATRDDFEAMKRMVAGEPRTLSEADLAYRTLGEARAARASAAADAAFAAYLEEVQGALLADPPAAPDTFNEDTRALVGARVRLPALGARQILFETRRSWYWSGSGGGGYLVDRHAPAMERLYAALDAYTRTVDPHFRDHRLTFVGVVQPEPALVSDAHRDITVAGLRLGPEVALVENASDRQRRLFVDLRPGRSDEPFAGAAALIADIRRPVLREDAGPGEVLMTAIEALKVGDIETWRACYATWTVRSWYDRGLRASYLYVDRAWDVMGGPDSERAWDRARRHLADDLYGVEVARVGPIRRVYDAADQPDGPRTAGDDAPRRVDEVLVVVNHIGKFGDEYRTFAASMLRRRWLLQRLDDGPWRITTNDAI